MAPYRETRSGEAGAPSLTSARAADSSRRFLTLRRCAPGPTTRNGTADGATCPVALEASVACQLFVFCQDVS